MDETPRQRADATSDGRVVQAGRDVSFTVVYRSGPPSWPVVAWAVGLPVVGAIVVVRGGFPVDSVLVWVLLAVAAIVVLVRRRPRTRTRQAFLVTSAFSQKYWIAGLVQHMHGVLDRSGVDLVLKVPDHDYDAAAQAHHLRRVAANRDRYLGGFVIATEVHRLRAEFAEFCAELAVPVVFTDIEPFADDDHYPDNAAFVGYDSADLGARAGQWLRAHLRDRPAPIVLIVACREHEGRQTGCAEVLRAGLPDVSITVDDSCAFNRSRAYSALLNHIRVLERTRDTLDAVFCTNDEMALGVVDALDATDSPLVAHTVVVGVDGTAEARSLIDSRTSPLRATVVQDSHRLAESAMHVLERMHARRPTPKRTILTPEIHQAT
ncbi:hypothetical protein GCM10022243_09810 [Saccharothrix violaceirubra]|uniref:Ribose transport system substrate-binding protein n=1 Tax=Saccharothrix violaceirubra TaxID=413306 RepID=A0A7W7WWP2_9PSEU|nr:substrate-binding domain-containing protein [Saccharothrix violaceirubra]MBB4966182.1 ribose transport system substrate-binding protein [Saccharothrix violaceirubra]